MTKNTVSKEELLQFLEAILPDKPFEAQKRVAAKLLHVDPNTVKAWASPVRTQDPPKWAIELLMFKTGRLPVDMKKIMGAAEI